MSKFTVTSKREKSLSENIIVIAALGILMTSFIYYFFKDDQRLTHTGFDYVAQNFSSRVVAVRAQWFMDKQPNLIKLSNTKADLIRVNSRGWIDFTGEANSCEKIWQAAMDTELVFLKQPVVVSMLEKTDQRKFRTCRYSLFGGEYFDYQMETGKVSKVTVLVTD